jgi:hypothetical protein
MAVGVAVPSSLDSGAAVALALRATTGDGVVFPERLHSPSVQHGDGAGGGVADSLALPPSRGPGATAVAFGEPDGVIDASGNRGAEGLTLPVDEGLAVSDGVPAGVCGPLDVRVAVADGDADGVRALVALGVGVNVMSDKPVFEAVALLVAVAVAVAGPLAATVEASDVETLLVARAEATLISEEAAVLAAESVAVAEAVLLTEGSGVPVVDGVSLAVAVLLIEGSGVPVVDGLTPAEVEALTDGDGDPEVLAVDVTNDE